MANHWHDETISDLFSWLRNGRLKERRLDSLVTFINDHEPDGLYLHLVKDIVSKGRDSVDQFKRDEKVIKRFFEYAESGAFRSIDEIAGKYSEEYSPFIEREGNGFKVMQSHFHRNGGFFSRDLGTRFKNKEMLLTSLTHYSQVFPIYFEHIQEKGISKNGSNYLLNTLIDYSGSIKDAINMRPSKKQLNFIDLHYDNLIRIAKEVIILEDKDFKLVAEALESIADTSLLYFEKQGGKKLTHIRNANEFYNQAAVAYETSGSLILSKKMENSAKTLIPKIKYMESDFSWKQFAGKRH